MVDSFSIVQCSPPPMLQLEEEVVANVVVVTVDQPIPTAYD